MFFIPIFSAGIVKLNLLNSLFESKPIACFFPFAKSNDDFWLGWGIKSSARIANYYANFTRSKVFYLEDGLLRSFFPGSHSPRLSITFDELGIYYNCNQSSTLERLLNGDKDLLSDCESFLTQSRHAILTHGLSKYNHAPNLDKKLLSNTLLLTECQGDIGCKSNDNYLSDDCKKILVVDQTFGDMSVQYGGANANTFSKMLDAALEENPFATIYVKTHPEVISGKKSGYLTSVKNSERVVVFREAVNPINLIREMDKVYVVTSGMGFEALMVGKPVVCFGVPWYAGWGLTDDRVIDSPAWARRTRKKTVDELFAAAYIHYTRYLSPVTHQRGQITDVIDWLIRQKKMANQVHGPQRNNRVIGFGFRRWKASSLKSMLGLHQEFVHFARDLKHLDQFKLQVDESVIYWGARPPAGLVDYVNDRKAKLLYIEDGFIRSVGLGSDLIRPLSLVMDERGLYLDATRPSDLEVLLNTHVFTDDDIARANWVRQFIIDHEISKYNIEPRHRIDFRPLANGRSIILVPGQVEDDASIQLGCTTITTNLDLLKAVRKANPNAFIVYKPHPDVLSGNRKGKVALKELIQWVDHIEQNTSVVSCIAACDEVHTMTSLTGFDALLRGKKVATYGQPFYAGWGLTQDRAEHATAFLRRHRKLSLSQLIAGSLLHYPIYWDWDLKGYTTCEAVLHRIVEERTKLEASGTLDQLRVGWLRRQYRKSKVVLNGFMH